MARYGSELNTMQALELLELPFEYCPADTVRRQYRNLAKKYHPDNSRTGDADRFEEVQRAYEYLSEFFEGEGGWTRSFDAEFRRDAENYAPPPKDLLQDVEAVQKALAARPIDYEGLLLRAEWLEHNLTDGSCDGAVLLKTLGEVQDIRDRVQKAEEAVNQIADRVGAVEEMIREGEDLLLERKSLPTMGNIRCKASLTRRFHSVMKRAEDCLSKAEQYRNGLSQIEEFCQEKVMSRHLLKHVQDERDHLEEVKDYYDEIAGDGKYLTLRTDQKRD